MSIDPNDNDESDDTPSERPRTDLDVLRDLFGDWFGLAPGPDAPDSPNESTENGENGDDDDTETIGSATVDTESGIPTFAGSEVYQHQADLVEVVDGDTLDVTADLGFSLRQNWRLRLAGIDTAEVFGVRKASDEFRRGKRHEDFAAQWLDDARTQHDGEWPLVVLSVQKGKYGRRISAIRRKSDGTILNDALISEFGTEVVSAQ
jgi:micrococcal nuclease